MPNYFKILKKPFLILFGILMFIACSYAENIIKPDGGNPLLKNLRVIRTWAPTGSCISTLDEKWVKSEGFIEAKRLINANELVILGVWRSATGWGKSGAGAHGVSDLNRIESLWARAKPIMDLIDLAIPAEELIGLEWWDTYSQYRIIFTDGTAANINKLASYINEMIAKDAMPKGKMSSEWADGKDGGGISVNADNSRRWPVGKGDTMTWPHPPKPYLTGGGTHSNVGAENGRGNITADPYPFPMEYIRPSAGGPHRVVLNQINGYINPNPFIYEADAYRARSGGTIVKMNDRSGRGYSDWAPKGREELREWWPRVYPEGWKRPHKGGFCWWPVAYPFAPGPKPFLDPDSEKECLKALTELIDNLARIATKHGLKVSNEQKRALFDRFVETECRRNEM